MSTTTTTASSAEPPDASRPLVIRIVVGYPWSKDAEDRVIAARADSRWKSIRDYVILVGEAVRKNVSQRSRAPVPFDLNVSRLRGTHGRMLLDNLRSRTAEADILIMDIGSSDGKEFNPNVLLETGMAIAHQDRILLDLFILKPAKLSAPSDLAGFLFTEYEVVGKGNSIKVVDSPGFRAALRSAVMRKARERGMVGQREAPHTGDEDEEDGESPKGSISKSGTKSKKSKSAKPSKPPRRNSS